ncbi:MAG: phenylacetate--CoA ligase [Oscillospiraceae bacterium]|nr:phenylacetate--CoA ligase [Oscillospiraceae bacterium]
MSKSTIWNPEMECMDPAERRKLQGKRLRETVQHEYDNVTLYRERMDAKGVKPEDIETIEDIVKLPFMEKTDLRDTFPFGLFAVPNEEIVRIQGSSGTTGKPIVSGYTEGDVEIWTEMVARAMASIGASREDVVQVCYGYGLFTGGLGAHQGATRTGTMVIPMSSGNTQRQLMMMQELGTTILCCTPSYAAYLGESIRNAGLVPGRDIKLRAGLFGAEPWTEAMREHIQESLGIDARDIYGLTEIAGPGVAFECEEKHGAHINEDHVIAEIIDPVTGKQLPYGTAGELVFTTITKKGMPMLRYRTHDICTLYNEKCACGRTTVRMGRITGRTDDMIVVRGVNVFPSQIETVLVKTPGVAPHYQLVVDRVNNSDTLEVKVEMTGEVFSMTDSLGEMQRLQKHIQNQIKSVVGIMTKVTLTAPGTLPRFEGKAKRVVDNRKL